MTSHFPIEKGGMVLSKVIYVHPETPMTYPRTIPISLPALIKRIPYKVNGYCATRLSDEVIKYAQIVLIDVHWFFSLKGTQKLANRIKNINQDCIIIAGGITATEFPFQLVEKLGIDYVVRGDAEIPLPQLVQALIEGKSILKIPNIVSKKKEESTLFSLKGYSLTKQDFDNNNFYDIDFIPHVKNELKHLHSINPGMPPFIYPFILPFRGCPINCDFCSGAPEEQKKIFGRKVIVRSPEKLREDFLQLEQQEWIKFFNCLLDFVTLLPDQYTQTALPKKSRLRMQYEFTKAPTIDELDFFLSRFSGGTVHFSVDNMHLTSDNFTDPDKMVSLIKRTQIKQEYIPILDFSSVYSKKNKEYKEAIKHIIKKTNCLIYDGSIWWSDFPFPDDKGFADSEKFDYFLNNAVTKKHFVANSLNKAINVIDEFSPKSLSLFLRKSYYRFYHRAPFKYNWI